MLISSNITLTLLLSHITVCLEGKYCVLTGGSIMCPRVIIGMSTPQSSMPRYLCLCLLFEHMKQFDTRRQIPSLRHTLQMQTLSFDLEMTERFFSVTHGSNEGYLN